MPSIFSRSSISALALAVALSAFGSHARAALDIASTTQPALDATAPLAQPAARTTQDVEQDLSSAVQSLRSALVSPSVLSDPAQRSKLAPTVIPIVKKILGDFDELATLRPELKPKVITVKIEFLSILSTLGDADASTQLKTLAASKDTDEMLNGLSGQFETRWMLADKDPALQTPIADELEKLDAAHPDSNALTRMTATLGQMAATPELAARLRGIAEKMTSPMAQALSQQMKQQEAAQTKTKANEGKPAVIAGKDPQGKPFTTADWKGKVILVDFWATWCGPCIAEMPRVKDVYNKYHSKGLEVLGVSNDYSADNLKAFVAKEQIPWQQLYDADAGSKENWNPITLGFGIEGIPTMFLIDKTGTIRSVEARKNMEELIPKLLAE